MKKFIEIKLACLIFCSLFIASCDDFEELNIDPKAAGVEQVQVEYFLNNSIIGAQMDPHIHERAFVLYWGVAGRMHRYPSSLAHGGYSDGWTGDYYRYISDWLKAANQAITVAEQKIANGTDSPYTENMKQVSRVWRAYLMSEFADNFGPMAIEAFNGVNPEFNDLKEVYYFILSELADASSKIDLDAPRPDNIQKFDAAYAFNYEKWVKYANSLRLRFAMRLSEVDPSKAQSEFEAAASSNMLITSSDDVFSVQERDGWDPLAGVMSRGWNYFMLTATTNNLYIGLGGIPSEEFVSADFQGYIKPADYMGLRLEDHFTTMTNDPHAGFWFDGLHESMDPRAYHAYAIPGDFDNPQFAVQGEISKTTVRNLNNADGDSILGVDAKGHWNAPAIGNWGDKGARNDVMSYGSTIGTTPRLVKKFRDHSQQRIFFADWETYFLLAEGAVRGWATPISAKEAYDNGVKASFNYWGLDSYAEGYLASENYNRVGTSVNFDHTDEPTSPVTMTYVNGYTGEEGTFDYHYPQNHLYLDGTVSNDHLTKIITQKYLAQLPYLPLESWNDHRRLGLPFFENPAVEEPLIDLPGLNSSTYTQSKVEFFPQRLKYPSSLENSNPDGYIQAVELLGGPDEVLTPLWWAQKE